MTKPISRKMAVDCLLGLYQIRCGICKEQLFPGDAVQFDHVHSDAMGGPHEHDNLRPVHYDPCHKMKSKRDVAALAKVDRITGVTKGPKKKAWTKGRKLQSRGFQKREKT